MFLYSLVVRSLHPFLFYTCFTSTADSIAEVRRARLRLREIRHAQCHVVQYKCNGVQRLETPASTESNRHGTNILVVKGTAHTRLKEIRAKATVIALASFDVGRL